MSWYLAVLKKYAVFSGRAQRMEYWMFTLFNFIIASVILLINGESHPQFLDALLAPSIPLNIYSLAVLLPGLAVLIRRLHDTNRSGWWWLIVFTLIGAVVLIVFLVQDSTEGENQYGPNPKAAG